MNEAELSFAKIVPTPSPSGWSQVYSAGKLFASLSLEKMEDSEEKDYLSVLGKEVLSTLEQEFFILETKDLHSIRDAVIATAKKVPDDVSVSLVVGSVVGDILYAYVVGNGRADIKRDGKLGTILEAKSQKNDSVKEISGFLQDKDIVVLQSAAFSETISESTLLEMLENSTIEDAAENLAPLVHEKSNPLASSILTLYKHIEKKPFYESVAAKTPKKEDEKDLKEESEEIKEETEEAKHEEAPFIAEEDEGISKKFSFNFSFLKNLKLFKFSELNHSRKVILTIIAIVIIVFGGSIFFAMQKQQDDKLKATFENTYPTALDKFEEGQSLSDINQSLARDSFLEAKDLLEKDASSFPENSSYSKQIKELLSKINEALNSTAQATKSDIKGVDLSESFYLKTVANTKAAAFTKEGNTVYYVNSKSVSSTTQGSNSPKSLFENDDSWEDPAGLSAYNTNIYILDSSKNSIIKFVNNGSDYSKSDYLSSSEDPDFSNAKSITIDNNIYVLLGDGTVLKYFKGAQEDFSLKGLDAPLKNPTKIYSNPDIDNIYVLDNGNSRIVVFDKTGLFKAEYQADIIKNATDFEVFEEDKTVFVLSGGKLYQLDLK